MIIIGLAGGLGNQLFQYSFARALSKELNDELFIDITNVNGVSARHAIYGLNSFNIKGVVGNFPFFETNYLNPFFKLIYYTLKAIPFFKSSPFIHNCLYYLENTLENIKFRYIEPNIYNRDSNVEIFFNSYDDMESPSYFNGLFQFYRDSKNKLFISERYFNNYLDLIHDDLMYLSPVTIDSQKIIEDMSKFDSVLLHIRHGDYEASLGFGLCSAEYYEKSIEIIASKVENPKFYIFSDDIEGAKKLLNINYPHVFVDFKENNELVARGNGELLKLMSSCKHFIIANSTLSWWAAFLSENKNKIIIAPDPWFQNRRVLSVETIDDKKPIKVVNNNAQLFNLSKNSVCKLNENDFSFKNLKYIKQENSYKIINSNSNSKILLNNKFNNEDRFIIKVSIESNCFNCLRIFFKTKDNNKYCDENFNVYYYDEDDFDQYLVMPKNAILDDLKIVPADPFNDKEDFVLIKSFEIRTISNMD